MVLVQARWKPLWFLLIVGLWVLVPTEGMGQPPRPRTDYLGDPLPEGAVARLGTERLRHPGAIGLLKFTDDNKSLVSVGYDRKPIVWSVETGKQVAPDTVARHSLSIHSVSSPDGKLIATLNDDGTEIEMLDKATNKSIFVRKNPASWTSLAISRDGRALLALSRDLVVTAWGISDGNETSKRKYEFAPWGSDLPVLSLAADGSILSGVLPEDRKGNDGPFQIRFWEPLTGKEIHKAIVVAQNLKFWSLSSDGQRLKVQFWDSRVEQWDIKAGTKMRISMEGDFFAEAFLHIPEKKLAVTAGWSNVNLREMETNKILWNKEVAPPNSAGQGLKQCRVHQLALSPDGKTIAAGTDNGYIELLDLATGERVGSSRLHPGFFSGPFQFVLGGKHALVTLGKEFVLWDLSKGKAVRNLDLESFLDAPSVSPDGQSLVQSTRDRNIRRLVLADVLSGKELWARDERDDGYPNMQFSKDGQTLAIFNRSRNNSEVTFVSARTGKDLQAFQPRVTDPKTENKIPLGAMIGVSDEMLVAMHSTDRTAIQLWDALADKQLWIWRVPADCVEGLFSWSLHFVPGGQYVIAETHFRKDSSVYLFLLDAKTGKQLEAIRGSGLESVSLDGRFIEFLAIASESDYHLEVRDLQSGEAALKLKGGYHGCFSADSKIFACGRDDTIEFYDLQTKQRLGAPRPHPARIREMSFSPSGSILAATYNDSTVILWDALAGSQ